MLDRLALLLLTATLLAGCVTAPATQPIPELDPKGDVYKTQGPNDPLVYDSTVGKKKAIMLYAYFPDKPEGVGTKERMKQVLGGDTFDKIFTEQSYGKMSVDIDHIHDWRALSKHSDQYNFSQTIPHRDFFVEAIGLYPEINFLEYDYIMVNIKGRGNTAFGARDDQAIPYRGHKINVALNIHSQDPYVLAHELAHCMGLPDLYTYGDLQPRNPAGGWDIMSQARNATGFIGWHRHKFGWLDHARKTYLTEGTHRVTLTPLDENAGVSMIAVPAKGEDITHPSKVYIAEVAQPIRVRQDPPKPGGVLVYSVDARLATGRNPVVVYPRNDKVHAAFHAGDGFGHDDAPFDLKVLDKNDDNSYEIEVVVK